MNGQIPNPPNISQTEQTPSGSLASSPIPPNEIPKENHSPVSSQNHTVRDWDVPNGTVPNGTGKGVLFEIVFVAIFLVLLFGILNYFNILRLSEIFPNYLGFLPHRPSQQSQQSNKVTTAPTASPSVSLLKPAKQTLINALPTILTLSILPKPSSDISLMQTKSIRESFSTSWDTSEGTISAVFVVSADGNGIVQSYLSFLKPESVSPSNNLSEKITSQFFSIKAKGIWNCKPIHTSMTYCENFWEEKDGARRGIGIKGLFTKDPNLINNAPTAMLFYCEHNVTSKLYAWKSCEYEFAESGVK